MCDPAPIQQEDKANQYKQLTILWVTNKVKQSKRDAKEFLKGKFMNKLMFSKYMNFHQCILLMNRGLEALYIERGEKGDIVL